MDRIRLWGEHMHRPLFPQKNVYSFMWKNIKLKVHFENPITS